MSVKNLRFGRLCHLASMLAFITLHPGAASATVINTYPDWDGNISVDYSKVAQSFLVSGENVLRNWEFNLAPIGSTSTLLFQVVQWSTNSGPTGAALFSRSLTWPTPGGDIFVDNINLTLTNGTRYAVVLDLNGYRGNSVAFEKNQTSYDQGQASWYGGLSPSWVLLNSHYNTEFRAEFVPAPEPSVMPLGLMCLCLAFSTCRANR